MNKIKLDRICMFCYNQNKGEALNGDDIEDINKALKEFNGDD